MLAASSNLDDWIQIIILVLIFGGSALGAIAKKLITFFGPPKDQGGRATQIPTVEADDSLASPRRQPTPTARPAPAFPSARPAIPLPPVAKPWPIAPVTPNRPATREPEKPILADLLTEVFDQNRGDAKPVPADAASPMALPLDLPTVRPAPPPKTTQAEKRRSKREAKPRTQAKKRRSRERKSSSVVRSETDVVDPEKRLGHLHSKIEKESKQAPAPKAPVDSIHRPTKGDMRRAIIMSEILRPPLALRADDETGF